MQHRSAEGSSGTAGGAHRRLTAAEALSRVPGPQGETFAAVFEHGTMLVEIIAPPSRVPLPPHTRDEAYVVVRGSGELLTEGRRLQVKPGDFFFVRAGAQHNFENFSDDLTLWAFFWGPEGGEVQTQSR